MSLLAFGLKVKRYPAVLIDAVVGTALSVYALFIFDFTNSFISFLSIMVLWIAPWCGIFLADMALRRGQYDVWALHEREGAYGYRRGANPVALGWFAAGIACAALFSSSSVFEGPLVSSIGGGDISIYVGFLVALVGYYLTMRGRVSTSSGPIGTSVPSSRAASTDPADASTEEAPA
jgi:NCS1 family nucleobase:cation symporter-1